MHLSIHIHIAFNLLKDYTDNLGNSNYRTFMNDNTTTELAFSLHKKKKLHAFDFSNTNTEFQSLRLYLLETLHIISKRQRCAFCFIDAIKFYFSLISIKVIDNVRQSWFVECVY